MLLEERIGFEELEFKSFRVVNPAALDVLKIFEREVRAKTLEERERAVVEREKGVKRR